MSGAVGGGDPPGAASSLATFRAAAMALQRFVAYAQAQPGSTARTRSLAALLPEDPGLQQLELQGPQQLQVITAPGHDCPCLPHLDMAVRNHARPTWSDMHGHQ